jgi:glucokinase
MKRTLQDKRIVLTLDAGGTNFRFSAVQQGRQLGKTVAMPSNGDHLERCLANMVEGFRAVKRACPAPPDAISFAFPAPADYPNGIIGDLYNLPGFRGGVPLGPMLEAEFGIPVFINNDGDLFVYGEAIAGFLPHVNALLEKAGSPKRYKNLFGVTLGTGFGGGIVRDGQLFLGDNSMAGEVWLMRNKLNPEFTAEEGASIRAVRRAYAECAGIPGDAAPEPKAIYEIGIGKESGNKAAAVEAFRRLGEVVGEAMGQALTLVDGLAVIGGGISGAWPLFLPTLVSQLRRHLTNPAGAKIPRLASVAFNFEDPKERRKFLQGEAREVRVPGTRRKLQYDPLQRLAVGMSRLGTSEAVAVGAWAYALKMLNRS